MRHCVALAISAAAAACVFQVPLRLWQQAAPYLFLFGAALLVLVLIPGIGSEVNGSRRWLPLVVMNLQPSELMKLFVVLYAADYTVRKAAWMHSLRKGFAPMLAVMLFVGALLLREPDFGAFAVITCIAMGVLFLGGMNWRLFVGLVRAAGDRLRGGDPDLALPHAAHPGIHGSVGRPLRQGLSAVACADRLRPRRVAGRGAGRQRREAVLPAGGAHRFPARGDRRGAGIRWA